MIYDSPKWWKAVDREIEELGSVVNLIDGKSVMVTGAAGLVCSALVDVLIRLNEVYGMRVPIYAAGRWATEMEKRFGDYSHESYFHFVEYDASRNDNSFKDEFNYIVHGASNAHPLAITSEPVETMLCNITGLHQLLKYAASSNTFRILYISSSEVYGRVDGCGAIHEENYGYIDLLNPRNSYSIGKRAAETLCASFASEYDADYIIARPGHIYGPTATLHDSRVASSWAFAAARGENIVMKSDGRQLRSWCHCLDCAAALLFLLLNGDSGLAYNISNSNSIGTIADLAEMMAEAGETCVIREDALNTEKRSFNPMENSSLDGSRLEALGWHGVFDMEEGVKHTVSVLRDSYLRKED